MLKAKDFDDHLDFEGKDAIDNVIDKGAQGSNESGQQVADEGKDSGQQVSNGADDVEYKGKNFALHCTGNKSKDTFDEEEDDLIDRLGQLKSSKARENVRTLSTPARHLATMPTSKRTPSVMLTRAFSTGIALMSQTAASMSPLTSTRMGVKHSSVASTVLRLAEQAPSQG